MNEKDRELILMFKNRLPFDVKGYLQWIIIFGSKARSESDEDSGIDVIVLVDKKT